MEIKHNLITKALEYQKNNQLIDAQKLYLEILDIDPNNDFIYYKIGEICVFLNAFEDAEAILKKAIQLNPRNFNALQALLQLYRNDNFEVVAEKFLYLINFALQEGNNCFYQEDYSNAKKYYNYILDIDSKQYETLTNLGSCYQAENKITQAKQLYKKALSINPNYTIALYNLSYVYLLEQDYLKGFELYQNRYHKDIIGNKPGGVAYPPTLLQSIDNITNKTIYINHEQGLGDTIQFIRFLPFFLEKKAKLISYVPPSLTKLFQFNYPDITFVQPNSNISFDYNFPMLESPFLLKTTYDSIPFSKNYLDVNKEDIKTIQQKYKISDKFINIGIVFQGSQSKTAVKNRSIELEPLLKELKKLTNNYKIYSLQYEKNESDIQLLDKYNIIDLGKDIKDFYDTAVMIKNMNLIISVDTSTLHLSGALGKSSIAMLKFSADWRWGKEQTKTAWYDSIHLLRQKKDGDWNSILQKLNQTIKQLTT